MCPMGLCPSNNFHNLTILQGKDSHSEKYQQLISVLVLSQPPATPGLQSSAAPLIKQKQVEKMAH